MRTRVHHGNRLLGGREAGVLLANPLPPFGALFVCQQPAVSWSADGAFSFTALASNPGPRPPQHLRWVAHDEVRSVEVDGAEVRVDGATFVVLASPVAAREVARTLEELRAAPRARRERAIVEAIERECDERAAARRLEHFRQERLPLDWAAGALFVHLFVAAPALVRTIGIDRAAFPIVAGFALLLAVTVAVWARADRALGGGARRGRRALALAIAPLSAVRAVDLLSRDLVAGFHPLAVACALEREEHRVAARELALSVLRDARTPREPPCPPGAPDEACAAEAWFRAQTLAALERLCVRAFGAVPEEVPAPTEGAFCPRCRAEYVAGSRECYDCGGIALIACTEPAGAREAG